jgi:hypothetical protein
MSAERSEHLEGLGGLSLGKHADLQIEMSAVVSLTLQALLTRQDEKRQKNCLDRSCHP